MKLRFGELFFILISLISFLAFSATQTNNRTQLSDLEDFVSRYQNVQKLLDDNQGLEKYRELLKAYMGYKDSEFDPVFEKTIEQMRTLVKDIPNFADQIWKNQAAGEAVINIQASSVARSGIETKLTVLEERLAEQKKIYEKEAQDILKLNANEQTKKAQELAGTARAQLAVIEARYPDDIKNASRSKLTSARKDSELVQARQKLAQERKDFFQNNHQLRALIAFIKYKVMSQESWLDRYRSPFAEDSLQALEDMRKLENIDAELGDLKVDELIKQNINYLPRDELYKKQSEELEAAKDIKKQINKTQDPKLNPKIIYQQKKLAWKSLQGAYQIEVVDLPEQEKFSLRDQNSKDIALRPVRAFHAAFTGHHTRECNGGESCANLTPRRWALSALNGVRTYMAEKGGTFDGSLRLVQVETPIGSGQYYDDVDAMLKSIDASSEIKSQLTGQTAKYPMFDLILDHLEPSKYSRGFIAGNGREISQNTGLAAVYQKSPSVITAKKIEKGRSIKPLDSQMEKNINEIFNDTTFGYNPGGMVYEAMAKDGKSIYLLKRKQDRRKYTKEELENILYDGEVKNFLDNRNPDLSENTAWGLAVESDVKLEPITYYKKDALNKYLIKLNGFLNNKNQSSEGIQARKEAVENVLFISKHYTSFKGTPELKANFELVLMQAIHEAFDHEYTGIIEKFAPLSTIFKDYPKALTAFINRSFSNKKFKRTLSIVANKNVEAFKAHPEVFMELVKHAGDTGNIYLLNILEIHLPELDKIYPNSNSDFKSSFEKAIEVASESENINELTYQGVCKHNYEKPEANSNVLMRLTKLAEHLGHKGEAAVLARVAEEHNIKALKIDPTEKAHIESALIKAIKIASEKDDRYILTDLALFFDELFKENPKAFMEFIKISAEMGDTEGPIPDLAQYNPEAFKAHPDALLEFIRLNGEKKNECPLAPLANLIKFVPEVFEAHPQALMELIRVAEKNNLLYPLAVIALEGKDLLDDYPEAKTAFKPAFIKAIKAAGNRGDIDELDTLTYCHKALETYPEAKTVYESAFEKAIKNAGNKGNINGLAQLGSYKRDELDIYPKAKNAFEPAFIKALTTVYLKKGAFALFKLVKKYPEAFHKNPRALKEVTKEHPKALREFIGLANEMEFIGLANGMDTLDTLENLAQINPDILNAEPEAKTALESLILKKIKIEGEKEDIGELAKLATNYPNAIKNHPEAKKAFESAFIKSIKAAGKEWDAHALVRAVNENPDAFKKHPKALHILKETLTSLPHVRYDYHHIQLKNLSKTQDCILYLQALHSKYSN